MLLFHQNGRHYIAAHRAEYVSDFQQHLRSLQAQQIQFWTTASGLKCCSTVRNNRPLIAVFTNFWLADKLSIGKLTLASHAQILQHCRAAGSLSFHVWIHPDPSWRAPIEIILGQTSVPSGDRGGGYKNRKLLLAREQWLQCGHFY